MAGSRYLSVRYSGRCVTCAEPIEPGDRAWWDVESKQLECGACRPQLSAGGESAQRVGERRFANRDRATREKHRIVGGLLMATRDRPQHEQSWFTGADGERRLAGMLGGLETRGVVAVHDRSVTDSRANIDHIAISRAGVFVIDSKVYKNKLVECRTPFLGRRELRIGGRDQTRLVAGMARQVNTVRNAVGFGVPVKPIVCFIDAQWPIFGKSFHIDGVGVCGPAVLRRVLTRSGPMSAETIDASHRAILRATRPA
jgi:hypothetical protein